MKKRTQRLPLSEPLFAMPVFQTRNPNPRNSKYTSGNKFKIRNRAPLRHWLLNFWIGFEIKFSNFGFISDFGDSDFGF